MFNVKKCSLTVEAVEGIGIASTRITSSVSSSSIIPDALLVLGTGPQTNAWHVQLLHNLTDVIARY